MKSMRFSTSPAIRRNAENVKHFARDDVDKENENPQTIQIVEKGKKNKRQSVGRRVSFSHNLQIRKFQKDQRSAEIHDTENANLSTSSDDKSVYEDETAPLKGPSVSQASIDLQNSVTEQSFNMDITMDIAPPTTEVKVPVAGVDGRDSLIGPSLSELLQAYDNDFDIGRPSLDMKTPSLSRFLSSVKEERDSLDGNTSLLLSNLNKIPNGGDTMDLTNIYTKQETIPQLQSFEIAPSQPSPAPLASSAADEDMELTRCYEQLPTLPSEGKDATLPSSGIVEGEMTMNLTISDFGSILPANQNDEEYSAVEAPMDTNVTEDLHSITQVFQSMKPKTPMDDPGDETATHNVLDTTVGLGIPMSTATPSLQTLLARSDELTSTFIFGRESVAATPSLQKLLARAKQDDPPSRGSIVPTPSLSNLLSGFAQDDAGHEEQVPDDHLVRNEYLESPMTPRLGSFNVETPKASYSNVESEGVQTPALGDKMSFQEFLALSGLEFLEGPTSESGKPSISTRVSSIGGPKSMDQRILQAPLVVPELELYDWGCEKLLDIVNKMVDEAVQVENRISQNNPRVFHDIAVASGEELATIKDQLKRLKLKYKNQAKNTLYEWRTKMAKDLNAKLAANIQLYHEDEEKIKSWVEEATELVASAKEEHKLLLNRTEREQHTAEIVGRNKETILPPSRAFLSMEPSEPQMKEKKDTLNILNGLQLWTLKAFTSNEVVIHFDGLFLLHLVLDGDKNITKRVFGLIPGKKMNSQIMSGLIEAANINALLDTLQTSSQLPEVLEEISFRLSRTKDLVLELTRLEGRFIIRKSETQPSTKNGTASPLHVNIQFSSKESWCSFVLCFELDYRYPSEMNFTFRNLIGTMDAKQIQEIVRSERPGFGRLTRICNVIRNKLNSVS